jgi:hypothetical protein
MASVIARDTDGLYRYVTEQLGALEGVERAEVTPVFRRVKQAGSLVAGARLPPPGGEIQLDTKRDVEAGFVPR